MTESKASPISEGTVSETIMEADVFSLEFNRPFEARGIRFEPFKDSTERYREAMTKRVHVRTGTVRVPLLRGRLDAYLGPALDKTGPFRVLLSFASGHDVFFRNWRADGGNLDIMMRFGRPPGTGGGHVIYPFGLERFLSAALPKLDELPPLKLAMLWYNEAHIFAMDLVAEITYVMDLIGIETLADWYAKTNNLRFLSEPELEKLQTGLQGGFSGEKLQRIRNYLVGLKWPSVREKTEALLQAYGLGEYATEIGELYSNRSAIVHSGLANVEKLRENSGKLERVFEKLLLKMLGVFSEDYVHSAIQNPRLLARE